MCQSPKREYLSRVLPLEILGSHTDVHLLIMEIMYLVNVLVWREGNTNYLATWEPFKSFLIFRLLRHLWGEMRDVPQICPVWRCRFPAPAAAQFPVTPSAVIAAPGVHIGTTESWGENPSHGLAKGVWLVVCKGGQGPQGLLSQEWGGPATWRKKNAKRLRNGCIRDLLVLTYLNQIGKLFCFP